jgi:hypothetical protein
MEKHDYRKEFRMTAAETVELMRLSKTLGISESDFMRMAFRVLRAKFIENGLLKDTGELPE